VCHSLSIRLLAASYTLDVKQYLQTIAESVCDVRVRGKECSPVGASWFGKSLCFMLDMMQYPVSLHSLTAEVHQDLRCSLQAS